MAHNARMANPRAHPPTRYQLVATRLQQPQAKGAARCGLCLWRCKLDHGQRGFCQAHVNRNGTLYNLSYGILSAIDVGAIEDKPVRHFAPGTRVLSIGGYGCSFRCGGCHNLDTSWGVAALDKLARGESTDAWAPPQAVIEAAQRADAQGIAFTYSEPAVWLEYVIDVGRLARAAGLYTVYVSNSFITDEALEAVAPYIDVLCSDIKSMRDSFYTDICRPAKVRHILGAIKKAHDLGVHVETRTNIIPGKNDSPAQYRETAEWIRDNLGVHSPWHITRFFPAYKLAHLPMTPRRDLDAAAAAAEQVGLRNVYTYADTGCDCATENRPPAFYLNGTDEDLRAVKKCAAACCGEAGVVLKKYEQAVA